MHEAIIGITGSGKTWAAQQKARVYRSRGVGTLILHKADEPWPAACVSWQTDNPDEFLRMYWASRGCATFMELADADVSRHNAGFHKCFTRGRHLGHRNHYMSQRGAMVHPNIRENCSSLCLFAVANPAAKIWAEEFNDRSFLDARIPPQIVGGRTDAVGAMNLPPHWFFFKESRFAPAKLMKLSA